MHEDIISSVRNVSETENMISDCLPTRLSLPHRLDPRWLLPPVLTVPEGSFAVDQEALEDARGNVPKGEFHARG